MMQGTSGSLAGRTQRVVRWLTGLGISGIDRERFRITGIARYAIHVSGRKGDDDSMPRNTVLEAFRKAEHRSEGKQTIVFYSAFKKGASGQPDGMLVLMRGSTFGEMFASHILQNPDRFLLGKED